MQDGNSSMTKSDTSSQARALARAITAYDADLAQLAADTPRDAIASAISSISAWLKPMSEIQLAARAEDMQQLAKAIGVIGNRIRPDFTPDQAKGWTASMVDALDDYPARIAIQAAREAKRDPIEFPAQVLKAIRERADRLLAEYKRRLARLERILKIHDHPPLLAASDEAKAEAERLSIEDLQEMPHHLRSLGLTAGFLVECEDGSIRWATDDEQDAHAAAVTERRSRARTRGETA